MMEHDNEQYADNAGNHLLQQQYNQNYNPSDAFSSHAYGHSDASWNVNATAFPQTTKLSHVSYQNGDWPVQQDAPPQRDTFSHSPLPGGSVYNGHGNYNGYDSATFSYAQPQQQYDPSLMPTQNSAFRQVQPVSQHGHDSRTIEPHALDNLQQRAQAQPTNLPTVPAAAQFAALHQAVPKGTVKGDSTIIDSEKLAKATKSEKLAAFLFIGKEPITWDLNRSALPAYVPRASKNDLKRAAGNDGQLLAKINSRSFKKQRIAKARSSRPMKSAGDVARSRNDLSSESDYSSDYSSDEDDEMSPLPSKRPEMPKEAMEYDTIQALWKSRKANVTAADIRKGLVDFWDLVKTVRDRWKLDGAAVTAAEEKGAKGELPMLRQRVKDSRDMIEVAFKAALHHGNRTIVSNFSENTPLLFLCYQFLLDRFKSDDINGPLAKTLLEVLSLATSITAEKLEKTFLGKVLPRFIKLGDAKTQHLARTVANKATPGKVEPAKVEKPTDKAAALAGNKRAAESDVGAPPKRPATASASAAASKAVPAGVKKVVPNGTAAKVTPADIVKPVQKASSLKSGLFAGLQSATKKPGTSIKTGTPAAAVVAKPAAVPVKPQLATQPAAAASKPAFSFADTMRSLTQPKEDKPKPKTLEKEITNETPEQKARRLRREARGPLRVHWKSADELVAIREFTHDPEEETGHDSSQVRDVADLQGEGRMFKQQHNKMELDDDEDEVDDVLRDWYEPKEVDFSDVPDEERQRNFYPYGGAQQKADSAENIERKKYEDSTLSVFYSHADDIPLTPRDPEEPISGEQIELKQFGDLGQQYIDRGAKLRASRQPAPAPAPIDFSALRNIMGMQPNAFAATAHAPPPPPTGVPDIGAIIAQLQQNKPQAPAQPAFMPQFAGLFPQQPVAAAPPAAGTPDIAAILAQINGGQSVVPPPVQAPALPFAMPPPPGMADPGFLAFLAQRAAQTQPPASSGGLYENADRKRMRDA